MDPLYGRLELVERACARMERARAGEGGLVLLTGEPGIGKSRLAEHVAGIASAVGCAVVWGRCWEAGGAPAYWPWVQVFRDLQLDSELFVQEREDSAGNAEGARFRAFDRAVLTLRARALEQPLLLVLDDLHAADVPSLLFMLLLARQVRRSRILVLGAYRDGQGDGAPEVTALLGKIAREAEVLGLSRLGAEHVASWLREASPSATSEQVGAIYSLTEGHPLFVSEVLRLGDDGMTKTRLLDGLRAVLDEHLSRLPAAARVVLEVAAVLGREFSADEVAVVGGLPISEVRSQLMAARAARVLVPALEREGRLLFSHVLLRDRIYEDIETSRRAQLHWLAGSSKLVRGEDAATAVHHLFEGHAAGQSARVAEVTLAAANAALGGFAFEEAAQLCRRALSLMGGPPSRLECELTLTLAQALMRAGNAAEGKRTCAHAAELARELGAGDLLADAALVHGSSLFAAFGDAKLVAILREALAQLPAEASAIRAKVMARLAAALNPPSASDVPEIMSLARDATAMARALGDDHTLFYVLQSVVTGLVYLVDERERFSLLQEIVGLGRALDQRMAVLNSSGWYIGALLARGEIAQAARELGAYEELLAEFPQPHLQWGLPLVQALHQAFRGDFERADASSDEARALAQRGGSGPGLRAWAIQRVSFAQMRGRPDLIAKDATQIIALFEAIQVSVPSASWILAATGQHEPAARRLRSARIDPGYFPALIIAADVCVMLADRELAEVFYAPLLAASASHQMFWGPAGGSAFGPTSRTLGDLAALLDRSADAVRHYDAAITLCERIGALPFVELIRVARGRVVAGTAGTRQTTAAARPAAAFCVELRREGEVWSVEGSTAPAFRLRHSKGLLYLRYLVEQPGREVHVLELAGVEHAAGDAGPVLDSRAKAEYRQRLDDLRDELQEAERFGDALRAAHAQEEIEAIAQQIAGGVGRGGRDRRAASDVERARINVQRRIKDTVERIAAHDPALARYFSASLHTGTYCSFLPR